MVQSHPSEEEKPKGDICGSNTHQGLQRIVLYVYLLHGGWTHRATFHVVANKAGNVLGNNFLKPLKPKIDCGETRVSAMAVEQCEILNDYPEFLKEEVETYHGEPHHIGMSTQAKATTCQLRNIPIARKVAVIKEIQAMDIMGIWEPVDKSEWVHPLVTVMKPDGGVRIMTDLTRLNQYVIPDMFPLPRIKDIFLSIGGSKIFSQLDLKKGYFHILLDDESRPLTTTITPLGLRRYKRLPMGLKDSASAFQKRVHNCLAGLEGVEDNLHRWYLDPRKNSGSARQESAGSSFKAVESRIQVTGEEARDWKTINLRVSSACMQSWQRDLTENKPLKNGDFWSNFQESMNIHTTRGS